MNEEMGEIFKPITKKLYPNNLTKNKEYFVCNWCGSDAVYEKVFVNMNTGKQDYSKNAVESEYAGDCCGNFDYPLKESEWEEKVIEDCNGNKDKYMKILDGERA
jgi:hypothetical protein|tara:strand:- start:647 stop:958 length:312 start_codon:yes stop_codon:yes gene_type:complete